jgi:hypothetical protein
MDGSDKTAIWILPETIDPAMERTRGRVAASSILSLRKLGIDSFVSNSVSSESSRHMKYTWASIVSILPTKIS